jgi:phosphomannomutase
MPTQIRFGTSGLRGLVRDLSDLEVVINTCGFLAYLRQSGMVDPADRVAAAGDLRESTERILRAVAYSLDSEGHPIEYLGRVPAPALAWYAMSRGLASIMVTGSHIPADRNGIKFNRPAGEVLKKDEKRILAAVSAARSRFYGDPGTAALFDRAGMLRQGPSLPAPLAAGEAEYRRRYVEALGGDALAGVRVLVYQHTAVGRDQLPVLLESLGAEVLPVGRTETFQALDTENLTAERTAFLRDLMHGHPGSAALVSTDGDGDRPLLLDEAGQLRRGDALGAVVARLLGADFVAVPISASDAIDHYLAPGDVTIRKTRIGSPYVIEAMEEGLARGAERVVGWEVNGGFLTASSIPMERGVLGALPTRDALLPLLVVLAESRRRELPLSGLFAELPGRFSHSGLLDHFPPERSRSILARFFPSGRPETTEVEFRQDGSILARAAGGPLAPLQDRTLGERLRSRKSEIEELFTTDEGFGPLLRLNFVDGLRMTFVGNDIAHIRPSGNAPQLRLYAVSDALERAEEIVRCGLAEPDGILRRLERRFGHGTPGLREEKA